MIERRKCRLLEIYLMLLLAPASVWISNTFKKKKKSPHATESTLFEMFFYAHTLKTHTIWKLTIQGRKWQVPNVHSMLLLDTTSVWSISTCKNVEFWSPDQIPLFFKKFISAHTLKAHTLYIPFESLWSKEENDGCQILIRCFLSILQVFEG